MKVLMVGDVKPWAGYWMAFKNQGATILASVLSLDLAKELLDRSDAVVCAESFPTHQGRYSTEPIETQRGNWAVLSNLCRARQKPFVLIVDEGRYSLAERFNHQAKGTLKDWLAFAFVSPVRPADVADALATAAKYPPPFKLPVSEVSEVSEVAR